MTARKSLRHTRKNLDLIFREIRIRSRLWIYVLYMYVSIYLYMHSKLIPAPLISR